MALLAGAVLARVPRVAPAPGRARNLAEALRPALVRLDIYALLLHAILTALFVALPLMLENILLIPVNEHWKLYVLAILTSLCGTVPLILADERRGRKMTMTLAICGLIAGLGVMLFSANGWLAVFIALCLFFAGFNFLEASLPARLSLAAPVAIRGGAMGVFASAQFLGAFVGGLFGGFAYSMAGPSAVFGGTGLMAIAWLFLHLTSREKEPISPGNHAGN